MARKRQPAKRKRRPVARKSKIESNRTQLGNIMFKELKELTQGTVTDRDLRSRIRERLREFTDDQVVKLLATAKK
jgi:hypothetical protein